jgi:NifU-like protein involved in Fe-S cluster formation
LSCGVDIFCSDIAKHLSLPPVKLHCSMLAEDAIKAAVKDYKSKKAKAGTEDSHSQAIAANM